jgi:GTP-binding protein EngB required for normal cell division
VTVSVPLAGGVSRLSLPARFSALSRLVEMATARRGDGGFSQELLADAQDLLDRAGERLALSAAHTVVTLAGGTGSGKSSLFNALAGANFSPAAVTRPATRQPHACVWGMEGAAPLLDWLGVQRRYRYARASALDAGEAALDGLLLLDLPDHDSVAAGATAAVDRLIALADLMIWVLDPQKYADAAVHTRYLAPLAGHAEVTTVVLNQCDLLTPAQARDCEHDLRRLLDSEGLAEARLLLVSAATGAGLDSLREVLAGAVSARQAASARITADIDALIARFASYAGDPAAVAPGMDAVRLTAADATAPGRRGLPDGMALVAAPVGDEYGAGNPGADGPGKGRLSWQHGAPGDGPAGPEGAAGPQAPEGADNQGDSAQGAPEDAVAGAAVPEAAVRALSDAFARAAGLPAVTEALRDTRESQAAACIRWPVARAAARLAGHGAAHTMRRAGMRGDPWAAAAVAGAQQPDIDSAITVFAGEVGGTLPAPWTRTVRAAARSRAGEIPRALGAAVSECMPARDKLPAVWKLVRVWQWALIALAAAGAAWIGLIVAIGVLHGVRPPPSPLLGTAALLPWLGGGTAAMLLLGWLTASWCRSLVAASAQRERERTEVAMRSRIGAVAREMVVLPAARELGEYVRFCTELAAVAGTGGRSPGTVLSRRDGLVIPAGRLTGTPCGSRSAAVPAGSAGPGDGPPGPPCPPGAVLLAGAPAARPGGWSGVARPVSG